MISGEAAPTPYLTILWHPRWTIRRIVDADPRRRALVIVAVAALLAVAVQFASSARNADAMAGAVPTNLPAPLFAIRLLALLLVVPLAIAMLYLEGGLIRWAGGLLGGTAQASEVRAALAWARIPAIAGSLAILALAALGLQVLPATFNLAAMFHSMLRFGGMPAWFVAWELVLMMATIAEVHRFSAWKSVAACIIAGFTFAGTATVIALTASLAALPFVQ